MATKTTEAELRAVIDGLREFNVKGLEAIARLGALADSLTLRVADLEAFQRSLQAPGDAALGN
jgi:hypothetical protein